MIVSFICVAFQTLYSTYAILFRVFVPGFNEFALNCISTCRNNSTPSI